MEEKTKRIVVNDVIEYIEEIMGTSVEIKTNFFFDTVKYREESEYFIGDFIIKLPKNYSYNFKQYIIGAVQNGFGENVDDVEFCDNEIQIICYTDTFYKITSIQDIQKVKEEIENKIKKAFKGVCIFSCELQIRIAENC